MESFNVLAQSYVSAVTQHKLGRAIGAEFVPFSARTIEKDWKAKIEITNLFDVKLKEEFGNYPKLTLEDYEKLESSIVTHCKHLAVYMSIVLRFSPNPVDIISDFPCIRHLPYTGVSHQTCAELASAELRYKQKVDSLLKSNAVACMVSYESVAAFRSLNTDYVFADVSDVFQGNVPIDTVVHAMVKANQEHFSPTIHVVSGSDIKKLMHYFGIFNVAIEMPR
ncbi:MAG: hypothetical protein IJH12_03160 [Clostridia bacterium]|nr:hypothetical protein [Clostridia bacterium]